VRLATNEQELIITLIQLHDEEAQCSTAADSFSARSLPNLTRPRTTMKENATRSPSDLSNISADMHSSETSSVIVLTQLLDVILSETIKGELMRHPSADSLAKSA
jgi:hypothetical protein